METPLKTRLCFLLLLVTSCLTTAQTLSKTEQDMVKQGLVDIESIDPSIRVSLMYSRTDNFTGKILYKDLRHAYLHPKAASALAQAQKLLKKKKPGFSLIIYDATRPMSVQQQMWNVVKGTKKSIYVSNPANGGGMHNYGLAVDLSICDEKGDTITMGTVIDYMGAQAHINTESQMLKNGQITQEAVNNRQLLREVMKEAGFTPLGSEWWHFNLVNRATARKYYKVIK